ncbi:MAG: hypothetical protein Q9194_005523 [Teloschistes cf. exilis]
MSAFGQMTNLKEIYIQDTLEPKVIDPVLHREISIPTPIWDPLWNPFVEESKKKSEAEILLQVYADPDMKPAFEAPALVKAVYKGNVQLLEMLLMDGVKVDISAMGAGLALPFGTEPITYRAATKIGDGEFVHMLLQAGVKADDAPLVGGTGRTAMYEAAKNINPDQKLLAVSHCMGFNTALFEAAIQSNYDVCQLSFRQGPQVYARDTAQHTAL